MQIRRLATVRPYGTRKLPRQSLKEVWFLHIETNVCFFSVLCHRVSPYLKDFCLASNSRSNSNSKLVTAFPVLFANVFSPIFLKRLL